MKIRVRNIAGNQTIIFPDRGDATKITQKVRIHLAGDIQQYIAARKEEGGVCFVQFREDHSGTVHKLTCEELGGLLEPFLHCRALSILAHAA